MKRLHQEYNTEHDSISYSKFIKLKPRNLLPMSMNKFINCLCEYCVNIELSIDAMRSFTTARQRQIRTNGTDNIVERQIRLEENEHRSQELIVDNENKNEQRQSNENQTVNDAGTQEADNLIITEEPNIESDGTTVIIIVENAAQDSEIVVNINEDNT